MIPIIGDYGFIIIIIFIIFILFMIPVIIYEIKLNTTITNTSSALLSILIIIIIIYIFMSNAVEPSELDKDPNKKDKSAIIYIVLLFILSTITFLN
jgi:glucan phosphoethanolaminetransferase (alkaline phosphatase superfamily)